jgi:hypothetical protein
VPADGELIQKVQQRTPWFLRFFPGDITLNARHQTIDRKTTWLCPFIFKTYSMRFPNTKRTVNEPAQRTKYQSIGYHSSIILKHTFLAVQAERERRSNVEKSEVGVSRKTIKYRSKKQI